MDDKLTDKQLAVLPKEQRSLLEDNDPRYGPHSLRYLQADPGERAAFILSALATLADELIQVGRLRELIDLLYEVAIDEEVDEHGCDYYKDILKWAEAMLDGAECPPKPQMLVEVEESYE